MICSTFLRLDEKSKQYTTVPKKIYIGFIIKFFKMILLDWCEFFLNSYEKFILLKKTIFLSRL